MRVTCKRQEARERESDELDVEDEGEGVERKKTGGGGKLRGVCRLGPLGHVAEFKWLLGTRP